MPDSLAKIPAYQINHMAWAVLDFIYPPRCGGCGKPGTRWCAECRSTLRPVPHQRACPTCDLPLEPGQPCPDCSRHGPEFDMLRSVYIYEGVLRKAIHRLKFQNDLGLAETFSADLVDEFQFLGWPIDLITAVPLSKRRKKERGYNQSGLLARNLAWAVKIPYRPALVTRNRETVSQVGLEAPQRLDNVSGAFTAQKENCSGQNILVIDDIATTGATLSACALALREAGACKIFALTLARAVHLDTN